MLGRTDDTIQMLNNLEITHIELEVGRNNSLAKDIIETITGVSGGAITVGGKITAGTVVYSGEASKDLETANKIFFGASLTVNIIDFLMIPLGYLYKLYKREKIPFNFENNSKWIIAGITLTLAIISVAFHPAAVVVSFISASFGVCLSIYSIAKYFYDYHASLNKLASTKDKVESLTSKIQKEMAAINETQDQLRLMTTTQQDNNKDTKQLKLHLAKCYHSYHHHCNKLTNITREKFNIEHAFMRQKSRVELIFNITKCVISAAVIIGTGLLTNPVTLPMGTIMLATSAIVGLLALITKKTIQIVQKRLEARKALGQRNLIEIRASSTSSLIKAFKTEEKTAAPSLMNALLESNPEYYDNDNSPPTSPDTKRLLSRDSLLLRKSRRTGTAILPEPREQPFQSVTLSGRAAAL
jgi:hypothetical protein